MRHALFQTDSSKEFQEIAKYSYDKENMRTRAIEEVQLGHERDYYDVLHLYKEVRTLRCLQTNNVLFFKLRNKAKQSCVFGQLHQNSRVGK